MADQDLGNSFVSFTATAAFALPEPFGIFVSGAITLIQSMFGGSSDDAIGAAFKAAVEAVINGVKQLLILQDLSHDKDAINDAMGWLNETTQKMSEMSGQDVTGTMLETLPKLESFITQGSSIRLAMENLSSYLKASVANDDPNRVDQLKTKLSGLDLYGMLVAVYVTELRLRLQFYSQVKRDDPNYDALIYDHYLDFRDQTNVLLTRLSEIVLLLSGELPSLAFTTTALQDPFIHFTNLFSGMHEDFQMHDPDAKNKINVLMTNWLREIDTMMVPSKKLITGYEEKLRDWSENLRPTKPPKAPTGDPGQKGGAFRARYAMTFANAGGEGPMSADSAEVTLNSKTSDSVRVPVDSMGLAQSRKIYRRLNDGPQEMIAIIPDNLTESWPSAGKHMA